MWKKQQKNRKKPRIPIVKCYTALGPTSQFRTHHHQNCRLGGDMGILADWQHYIDVCIYRRIESIYHATTHECIIYFS